MRLLTAITTLGLALLLTGCCTTLGDGPMIAPPPLNHTPEDSRAMANQAMTELLIRSPLGFATSKQLIALTVDTTGDSIALAQSVSRDMAHLIDREANLEVSAGDAPAAWTIVFVQSETELMITLKNKSSMSIHTIKQPLPSATPPAVEPPE